MIKKRDARFKKILNRQNEDLFTIKSIESFFNKKRGYVVKIPKPGSNVILLVSGGLDSITTWAILMKKYKLIVHPITINNWQGKRKSEMNSLSYYCKLFKRRYPKCYVEPFHVTYPSSPPEIKEALTSKLESNVHPQIIKDNYDKKTNSVFLTRKYLYPAWVVFPAARASLFFEMQRNIKIKTIFTGTLPTDGDYNESQTLTSLRAAMLSLCASTNDYTWQILSLCFEKEIPSFFQKSDLISWADKNHLPLQFTYSCLLNFNKNCGYCINCIARRNAFKMSGVEDETIYEGKSLRSFIYQILKKIDKYINYKILKKRKFIIKDYSQ